MSPVVLLDTGPLVAFLDRREEHHEWARREFGQLHPPLLTCEAVIAEACWLVRGIPGGAGVILELLERGIVKAPFRLEADVEGVRKAMDRYSDLPMSLADACLIRMAEMYAAVEVLTLDSHFKVYRLSNRRVVPVRMPVG